MATKLTVVFISGFLSPSQWRSHAPSTIPDHVELITVNPSPTGSLHDRACQIFYELYGGTVDYGEEHSKFHKHDRFGRTFSKGKLKKWGADHPIILIGHSLGGSTAWVLHNYLAMKKFSGYNTSGEWIVGIICVNAPLNGALQVHSKGMDMLRPPIVRWGSPGCVVGWLAQWSEFFSIDVLKHLIDFQHEHWRLTWRDPAALHRLFLSLLGFCLHSGTDNVAYDVTVRSQLEWAKVLQTLPSTYYISVVGRLPASSSNSWVINAIDWMIDSEAPKRLCGIDTSQWTDEGSDGLLSVYTQECPRLASFLPWCSACSAKPVTRRVKRNGRTSRWPITEQDADHRDGLTSHRHRRLEERDLLLQRAGGQQQLQLERGVWHSVHREMSHLTSAFACVDTWTLLMRSVQVIADNYRRTPLYEPAASLNRSGLRRDAKKDLRTTVSACARCSCNTDVPRPDRQSAACMHPSGTDHSSLGMGYRWRNVSSALLLASWGMITTNTLGLESPRSSNGSTFACVISFAVLLIIALGHLLWMCPREVGEVVDLPNYTHLYSDALSLGIALYRVLSFQGGLKMSASASSIFLWEAALQYLLPRPLLDHGSPLHATTLAVLLATCPAALWARLNTQSTHCLLLVLTALPQVSWGVIHATEAVEARRGGYARGLREVFVCLAEVTFVLCWAALIYGVYQVWAIGMLGGMQGSAYEAAVLVLFGVLPLRWFQDLSECFQYVMIARHYRCASTHSKLECCR